MNVIIEALGRNTTGTTQVYKQHLFKLLELKFTRNHY
jgi:hypothetical protein